MEIEKYYKTAIIHSNNNNYDKAIEDYKKILMIEKTNIIKHYNELGNLLEKEEN
jgi:tetratricopeptide (TPR) repeat protein